MQWQALELFSGVGNVSAFLRESGVNVCSFDRVLGGRCMDFTESSGFLLGA